MNGGKVLHLHHNLIRGMVLQRGIQVRQLTADHLCNDLLLGHLGHIPLADVFAIAHDGHFVSDDFDLIHLVADIDQRHAQSLQLTHDAEQRLHFVRGQRGSRLVQNQHLAVCGNSLCDFHHLHLCDAQRTELCMGVDLQLQLFQQFLGILVHFGVIHHRDGAVLLGGVAPQPDVLSHRARRDGLQLLMNHGNASVQCIQWCWDGHLFAFVFDLALVHLVNAEHAFHQGGLACAVFAHQRHDFTGAKLQLGVIQRFDAGEGLDHAFHYQTVF